MRPSLAASYSGWEASLEMLIKKVEELKPDGLVGKLRFWYCSSTCCKTCFGFFLAPKPLGSHVRVSTAAQAWGFKNSFESQYQPRYKNQWPDPVEFLLTPEDSIRELRPTSPFQVLGADLLARKGWSLIMTG